MQLPIQSGVRVHKGVFVPSYPENMEHRVEDSGVSRGQLVTTRGASTRTQGPGTDRGGFAFKDQMYRVMGGRLVRVAPDAVITDLGAIGGIVAARFAQSFDRLAIAADGRLYLYGTSLTEVTDPDLGQALDVTWLDGYFITTDGEYIVVTELNDPTAIDPLKYGSAEADPDPVTGLLAHREELVVFGRYSIQFFQNVGSSGFPFRAVKGATIPQGCVSPHAKAKVAGTFAFVGSGKDEPLGLFIAGQGSATRVSDNTIDALLNAEADPSTISMETRQFGDEQHLIVHLSECSVALSMRGSQEAGDGLWHVLRTGGGAYRPRNAVWCYNRHWVGDVSGSALGVLDNDLTAHFGQEAGWSFDAGLIYGEGSGMIVSEVRLAGHLPRCHLSMTRDGEIWSMERAGPGIWRPCTRVRQMCGFRFRGKGRAAIARFDAEIEPLAA